jgi:ribosome maturation factor RimP
LQPIVEEDYDQGTKSPLFYYLDMIAKEKVAEIILSELKVRNIILVDLAVNNQNKIKVITRIIEAAFDREIEDYELEVGSAGVGQPFRMKEQYDFNKGRTLSILDNNGRKHTGRLLEVELEGIILEEDKEEKINGKKKVTGVINNTYTWAQIKIAKVQVSFK